MKILFIYPNANSQLGFHYGIAHMAALLKEAGHNVLLWQLCEEISPLPTREEFQKRLQEMNADLIGFSVVTNQWAYTKTLAAWVKEATQVPLVCGGVHTLASPKEILESGLFDYIFRGEAEFAFLEFVNRLTAGKDFSDVSNLAFMKDGKIQMNPVGLFPDLTKLPFKDYEIFDFQKIIDAKQGWVGLMASRGCPFSCSYCFNHQMVEQYREDLHCSFQELHYIRHFSVGQVIAEIQYLLKNYRNISMFIFDDDLFTYDPNYVQEFCDAYKKVSDIPFVVNAHFGFFDEDRAKNLSAANCKIVKFGVESGSERIRRTVLNRHMKNEKIIDTIRMTNALGMHTSVFLMIGLPNEKHCDVMDTIQLMAKSQPGRYRWTYFYPYPGTKSYEMAVQSGSLDEKKMKELTNFTESSCLTFGKEHDLFLRKVGKLMPWFVNAYADFPVSSFYRKKIEEILALSEEEWNKIEGNLRSEDKAISQNFVREGLRHYAIKYNSFMGVISDYFTKER